MKLLTANEAQGAFPPSYYAATVGKTPARPVLEGDRRVDVCVIGGGFTGLSAALHLAERGMSVALVEAHRVGWGASGRNGGQLGHGQRREQPELEEKYGKDTARALWTIALESVETTKRLIASHAIECDLKPGIIHANHRKRFDADAQRYADHMAQHYDHAVRYLPPDELAAEVKSPRYSGGVLDLGSAHLHPLKFANGLAAAAERTGACIYEMTEVTGMDMGDRVRVRTAQGTIKADHVVVGCNGYLDRLSGQVAQRVMPINNFIIATEPVSPEAMQAIIANDYAVADSKFVVNYFRFSAERRLLFGGRESYGYKYPSDIKGFVRKAMVGIFPQTEPLAIDYGWGGTLAITMSRLPYLARIAPNVYNASGYSGHGVGMATMSGRIMAEAIAGQAGRFDVMAGIETALFPGGPAMRHPLLIAAMLWHSMLDRL